MRKGENDGSCNVEPQACYIIIIKWGSVQIVRNAMNGSGVRDSMIIARKISRSSRG